MATETELKFRIPPQRLAGLRRAVATARAEVQPLDAAYFDTPGKHLAHARCALRLRREGSTWVQTLKAEGAGPLQRLEHNVVVAEASAEGVAEVVAEVVADPSRPPLEVARHAGTPAGAALQRLLAGAGPAQPLAEVHATVVQRTRRLLRSGGALVELALDEGEVRAGARRLALSEIEFELLRGDPRALLALAGRWAARHGLLLDMRSKSELGHNLAAGLDGSPPAPAAPGSASLAQALRPLLANASQLAAGPAQPGHLQQLRLGLERLRAGLARAGAAPVPAALAQVADRLALVDWQAGSATPPGLQALLCRRATQQLWLDLLALGLAPGKVPG